MTLDEPKSSAPHTTADLAAKRNAATGIVSCVGARTSPAVRFRPAFLLTLLPLVISGCDFFAPPLLTACEEVLEKRLHSPSGYRRISYVEYKEEITIEDWLAFRKKQNPNHSDTDLRNEGVVMKRANVIPEKYGIGLEYDAPNAYGTPVRGHAICEYFTNDGDADGASSYDVLLDGTSMYEWWVKQIEPAEQ